MILMGNTYIKVVLACCIPHVWSQATTANCGKSLTNTINSLAKFTDGCSITWGSGSHPYPLQVVYFNYPPYIYQENGVTKGILVDLFNLFLRQVCENGQRDWPDIRWVPSNVQKMEDLIVYCKDSSNTCHFAMPLVSFIGTTDTAGIETSKIHSFPGFAIIRPQRDQVATVLKSLGNTFVNLWPIFYISMAGAFFSGFIVWFIENNKNEEDFPKTFRNGCYEGFWWAYISMTTVGYGDIAPISLLGRLFSIFWILFGISLIAIITSLLSNAITEGTSVKDVQIDGNTIGCLDIMPAAKSVIQIYGGKAKCNPTIEGLMRDFALGYTSAFLMDVTRVQYFAKTHFKSLDSDLFVYQSTISYENQQYSTGFWSIKNGPNNNDYLAASVFRGCSSIFQTFNKGDYKSVEENAKETYSGLLDSTIISQATPGEGVAVLDPESDSVKELILYITLFIFIVLLFGLFYDLWHHYKKKNRFDKSNSGYVETEQEKAATHLNPEERGIVAVVDRTMRFAEEKMQQTEKEIRNEIAEMSRIIRRELSDRRKFDGYNGAPYPALQMNNLYQGNYPYRPPNNAIPPSNVTNLPQTKSFKNMGFQY